MDEKGVEILLKIMEKLGKIEERLDKVEKRLEKVEKRLDEVDEKIDDVKAKQHLFEHEYGNKIDAIFDSVSLELDKNKEKSDKIRKLEGRMDRIEATSFNHEKRISSIELKS